MTKAELAKAVGRPNRLYGNCGKAGFREGVFRAVVKLAEYKTDEGGDGMTKEELQNVVDFLESARQHGTVDGTLDKDAFDAGYKIAMMVLKLYPIDEKEDD